SRQNAWPCWLPCSTCAPTTYVDLSRFPCRCGTRPQPWQRQGPMSRPETCGTSAHAEEDELMSTNGELYEKDFYAWTQETAALIAAGKWHEIDQALLADEVAGLGRDDQREIAQRVQRLLKELLLWWALPGERKGNWASAIIEKRARLE